MFSTFNSLAGEPTGEDVAKAVESVAETSQLDIAAIVTRFNSIEERLNKIDSTLNQLMTSQISEPEPEPEAEPEPVAVTETEEAAEVKEPETVAGTAEPEPEQPEADARPEVKSEAKAEMRVDEMLTRREARELRKAFTLNDKFRFRRELFNNDNDKFRETLERIERMQSNDEAVAYMTEVLGWNLDEEAPSDFAAIVANHFAGF